MNLGRLLEILRVQLRKCPSNYAAKGLDPILLPNLSCNRIFRMCLKGVLWDKRKSCLGYNLHDQ